MCCHNFEVHSDTKDYYSGKVLIRCIILDFIQVSVEKVHFYVL